MQVERISRDPGLQKPTIEITPDGKVRYCTFKDPFGDRPGFIEELVSNR